MVTARGPRLALLPGPWIIPVTWKPPPPGLRAVHTPGPASWVLLLGCSSQPTLGPLLGPLCSMPPLPVASPSALALVPSPTLLTSRCGIFRPHPALLSAQLPPLCCRSAHNGPRSTTITQSWEAGMGRECGWGAGRVGTTAAYILTCPDRCQQAMPKNRKTHGLRNERMTNRGSPPINSTISSRLTFPRAAQNFSAPLSHICFLPSGCSALVPDTPGGLSRCCHLYHCPQSSLPTEEKSLQSSV